MRILMLVICLIEVVVVVILVGFWCVVSGVGISMLSDVSNSMLDWVWGCLFVWLIVGWVGLRFCCLNLLLFFMGG